MKKKVTANFDASWVLSHNGDAVLPVDKIINALERHYSDSFELIYKSFNDFEVVIDVPENADLKEEITVIILNETDATENNSEFTVQVSEYTAQGFENVNKKKPELSKKSWKPVVSDHVENKTAGTDDEWKTAVVKKMDTLVGCDDVKSLVKEYMSVASQIKLHNTYSTFLFQNFIFSINDGCGLSTYLDLLTEVIDKLGLFRFKSSLCRFEEITMTPINGESEKGTFDRYIKLLQESFGHQLVCLDISEFITRTGLPEFRSFLKSLEDMEDKYMFVFRLPFVEADILENICSNIEDVLFSRTVTVAPFTHEELHLCAEKVINEFGFKMTEDSWDVFDSMISEEKNDGRFYGLNTVRKIVNKIVYKKQLCNAEKNEDSLEICKNDITGMSKTFKNTNISADEMLAELIGIEPVKEQLYEIVTQIEHALTHKNVESPCIHMRFVGNPGTGKTTVARILGKMLRERGILRNGNFFEYSGRDFCGRYIGETAMKAAGICRDAYGSVLFIDEAYSLYTGDDDTKDFGREALTTLIAEMENHRNDLVVIMAGYRDDMSILMKGNAGLESRMPFVIDFKNYSRDDLAKIFMKMVKKANFDADSGLESAVKDYFDSLSDEFLQTKEFSNARFVRNLFERTWGKAASRCRIEKHDNIILRADDLQKATGDSSGNLNTKKKQRIGF